MIADPDAVIRRAVRKFQRRVGVLLPGTPHETEDLIQEGRILAIQNQHRISQADNPDRYLFQVVYRGLFHIFRQTNYIVRQVVGTDNYRDLPIAFTSQLSGEPRDHAAALDPTEEELVEMRQVVRRLIGPLPKDKAVQMVCDYYGLGLTAREVAVKHGHAVQTAKNLLHRHTNTIQRRHQPRESRMNKYSVGDKVVILVPENERMHGTEGTVKKIKQEPHFDQPYYLLAAPAAASGEFRVLAEEMRPVSPPPDKLKPRTTKVAAVKGGSAKAMGYTGDMCPGCGGAKMVRNGSCLLCQDCGSTTGCS